MAEDLGRTPTEVFLLCKDTEVGPWPNAGDLWGWFCVVFFLERMCREPLVVTSVYKNRMDWMWLIKMTCSSAFLNYLILVKRLGVLMDCIYWTESSSLMVSVLVTIKIHPICRHLWRPRRGNNMQVLRQRNAEYIGVKVAMAILPLAWKSPRQGHVIVLPYWPYLIILCRIPEDSWGIGITPEMMTFATYSSPRLGNHHSWSLLPDSGIWS